MNHYKIYGMHFVSDFVFLQLTPLLQEEAENPVVFTITEGMVPDEYKIERNCYSYIGKSVSYLANHTCYLLVENGNRILYEKKPGADDNNLNAYLLGWGLAMICFQQNMAAFHCSCVVDEKGAILIGGRSGSGKSTITRAFLQKGYRLAADDMVVVESRGAGGVYALPAFPYQKLCRDAAASSGIPLEKMIYIDEKKDKFLVPYQGEFKTVPIPIRAMMILGWIEGQGIEVTKIEGVAKLHTAIEALFLKVLFKEKLYCAENIAACLNLASCVPMYAVSRDKGHCAAEEVVEELQFYHF